MQRLSQPNPIVGKLLAKKILIVNGNWQYGFTYSRIEENITIIAVTPIPLINKLGFYLFLRFIEFESENGEY